MRTIVHLSDLHFGKVDYAKVEPILAAVREINPDIVVISGDLTERATRKEFAEAKAFIDKLKKPVFVIPGNHDIPQYNIFRRFYKPFKRYYEFIGPELAPIFIDHEMAIIGINSVRSSTISSGRVSKKHILAIEERLKEIPEGVTKIIVSHHPFDVPAQSLRLSYTHKTVAQAKMAVERLSRYGIDLFLSGHLHLHHVTDTTARYKIPNYSGLIIQAGTTISKRMRGEPVSFNVIKINHPHIEVMHYASASENKFSLVSTHSFKHQKDGWKKSS